MADLVVPTLGESITEAVIARWLKNVGDTVAADEPLVDLETDKITVELRAPAGGVLGEQRFKVGATVRVGQVIGQVAQNGAATRVAPAGAAKPAVPASRPPTTPPPAPAAAEAKPSVPPAASAAVTISPPAPPPVASMDARLSPAQRKSLREHPELAATAPSTPATPAPIPAPGARGAHEEVVPMSPLRKRIAERLVQAQHTAAILTTFNEVDMTAVMALRKQFGDEFAKTHGCKLGFMSFFVKAAVAALQRFPGLNAEVRGDAIVYKKHYDIGIAVGGGKGLVVPVLRGADRLGFAEIERGITELAQKASDSKLTLEELSGGTFSITNGGIYGSMMSTPLLNMPQTGILGMHNIVKRAVVVGDAVVVRPMMYLAVSYDHRVVDGREAVQFLVSIKERLESPDRLLFSL